MTKPVVVVPTWATDASYASPGDPWDATPTKVDPGAPQRAEGWEPGEPHPAQFENWDRNAIGQWLGWADGLWTAGEEHVYDLGTPRQRIIGVSPFLGEGTDDWIFGPFGVSPNAGLRLTSAINNALWCLPLNRIIPAGGVVTEVRAMVQPGANRAAQTSVPGDNGRMTLHTFNSTLNFGGASEFYAGPLSAVEDAGGFATQVMTMSGLSINVNPTTVTTHVIVVTAGNTGGASPDDLIGIRITFDDSGLRNI